MGCYHSKTDTAAAAPIEISKKNENESTNTPVPNSIAVLNDSPVKDATEVKIQKEDGPESKLQKACFGAGCYWGTEKYMRYKLFDQLPSSLRFHEIVNGAVGFMGDKTAIPNPTYKQVCTGTSGHVEVYHFEYTNDDAFYEQIVRYFFQFHDPTTVASQGNDTGRQYSSIVYYYTPQQRDIAIKVKQELQTLLDNKTLSCFKESSVVTEIVPATTFYPAHDEHQDYLTVNPKGYCNHRLRFKAWP